ncbi:MAG: carbamate kinase [Thermotogae bacterium]|nr:carbamate kinase [Thermotogota bacterium]
MNDKKLTVVAIGGNAIKRAKEKGTFDEQMRNLAHTCKYLADMIDGGYDLILTHGNGPQVGALLVQQDAAKEKIPSMPIDVHDANTQGSIGYMISQSLSNVLLKRGIKRDIAAIVTQVIVDKDDPAFQSPAKPVGPFYSKKEGEMLGKEKGWTIVEDAGRGYRRVVPSPQPLDIVEKDIIKSLVIRDVITIAVGGGGIPVIRKKNGELEGIDAVIDKDRASSLLARLIDADLLVILTSVEKVYLNFGREDQKALDTITADEAEIYMEAGHFAKGSMKPKVESAIAFVRSTGKEVIITELEKVGDALAGKTGTRIIK